MRKHARDHSRTVTSVLEEKLRSKSDAFNRVFEDLKDKDRQLEELRLKCESLEKLNGGGQSRPGAVTRPKENKAPSQDQLKRKAANDTIVISDSDDDEQVGYVTPEAIRRGRRRQLDRDRGRVGYNGLGGREPVEDQLEPPHLRQTKRPRQAVRPKSKPRDASRPLTALDNMFQPK